HRASPSCLPRRSSDLDSSEIAITVVSLDGAVERMNRRWTEIWGVDAEMIRADPARATQLMVDQVVDPAKFLAASAALAATDGGEDRKSTRLNSSHEWI